MTNAIEIHNFCDADLEQTGALAETLWAGEVPGMPEQLYSRIYQYLVRYYYDPASPYNLCAWENGGRCAFLLASDDAQHNASRADQWIEGQLHSEEERHFFQEYRNYLNANRCAELRYKQERDCVLLFFGSVRKGAGKHLMAEFEQRCLARQRSGVLLWTDESCNFNYYHKNGFTELSRFPCAASLGNQTFQTWIFHKKLHSIPEQMQKQSSNNNAEGQSKK